MDTLNQNSKSDTGSEQQVFVTDNNTKSDSFITRSRPGKITGILLILLIIAGVPLAIHLLSQPTNVPVKASSGTTLSISGDQNYAVGQHISLGIFLDPGGKAISSAKIVITYNGTKLQPDVHGMVSNPKVFPSIIQGPTFNPCTTPTCTMTMTLSIGEDPTQILTQKKQIAILNFTALQITGASGTRVSFDDVQSQVFSVSSNTIPDKSILATTVPIDVIITRTVPSGSPTSSLTVSPTTPPSPSPTGNPNPSPSTTVTTTPTPTPTNGQSTYLDLALSLDLPHDSSTGGILSPQHPIRNATIYLYKPTQDPTDKNIQPLYTVTDTVTYTASSQNFVNHRFSLGQIPTGTYQVLVKVNQYLRKLLTQGVTLQSGGTTRLSTAKLYAGDIMPQLNNGNYGDNLITINDYSLLVACFGSNANNASCANPTAADIDDNGIVDGVDYNILVRNIVTIKGSHGNNWPTPTITPQPTDTKLSLTLFLDGIGKAGDNTQKGSPGNMNPLHPTRQVKVSINNTLNSFASSAVGSVTYDASQGAFVGTIDAGNLPTGLYTIQLITPQYLGGQIQGAQSIKLGQINKVNPIYLIAGDINGDNVIDLADYQLFVNCYNTSSQTLCSNTQKAAADLNDDGVIDLVDYNIFIRELSVHHGD